MTRITHSAFFNLFAVNTCPDQCFVWFAAMFSQISCLKSRKIQTAWISLNSYRSKTSRAFSELGMWARALIFWVVTCGTHRYYQNTLQRDLKHFWKSCHPSNPTVFIYDIYLWRILPLLWYKTQTVTKAEQWQPMNKITQTWMTKSPQDSSKKTIING